MIACSVCGCLNDPSNAVCKECGSDLIDESELISIFEDDSANEMGIDDNDFSTDPNDYDYDEYEDDY